MTVKKLELSRFRNYALFVLSYDIATILWGAWVRISGSGAGCGSHWPTCNGEFIPRSDSAQTWIEYSHRLTSGLTLVFSLFLLIWAFRAFSAGSLVRKGAIGSFVFVMAEAVLGAGLVLFELVGDNDSVARACVISLHLVNTFALLGFVTLTVWGSGKHSVMPPSTEWLKTIPALTVSLLFVGMTGAITALGDTLFPVDTTLGLMERLAHDLSAPEHFLVRLRYIHPIVSALTAAGLIWISLFPPGMGNTKLPSANRLLVFVLLQGLIGWGNVELGAPAWMQLLHLFMADILWISFVWFALELRRKA